MAKTAADRVSLRGGIYYYIRRVPQAFAVYDPRVIIRLSLRTDNLKQAQEAAIVAERELEALWASLAGQSDPESWKRYQAAIERARLEGFVYRSAAELAHGRLQDVLQRMEALDDRTRDRAAVAAIAGGVPQPELTLEEALKVYYTHSAANLLGKRNDQIRRWKNPRALAVSEFIACVGGDRPIDQFTREDAIKFRDLWLGRIRDEGFGRNSMNKQMSHLSRIWHVVGTELKLGLEPIFAKLTVRERKRVRPPFTRKHVEEVLLMPSALAGLNLDARVALLVCAETGMGAEEVTSLREDSIHLDAEVPYIEIIAREGAEQKTEYRPRLLPLVGVALDAMRHRPKGIERYYDKNASLSAVINKFLRDNKLLPSARHSLYSLRHSFQDRLTESEAPDRIQADLMGHKYVREKYGLGPDLKQKQRWLKAIAYAKPKGFTI